MTLWDKLRDKLVVHGIVAQKDIWKFEIKPGQLSDFDVYLKSDLARIFLDNNERQIHKWLHYLDVYDRFFSPFRGTAVKILEIGVSKGGSLEMWRRYFGADATIFGIDVDPTCAERVTYPNQVRIGSQDDQNFLKDVVGEMGSVDIVIDDGSHVAQHQIESFTTLFPLINAGGVYVIEDLHTAYWPGEWKGGYHRPGTALEYLKLVVDDLHSYYHCRRPETSGGQWAYSICFFDSIAVVEKREKLRPAHIQLPLST